ncbi:MAG TPA: PAS domain S-box protein [Methanosarcina sp.]|nr:PAS domain S-box protein [Methanosarcina sp.]
MRERLRKSGIDIIGDVPWGTHFCQFYQTREDLIDILVPYFKAGLENNELCVWITSQPLEIEEAKEALKLAVPDIDVYLEKGQMEIIPYTHGYLKEGIFDPERVVNSWVEKINLVLERGYDGLRAAGDNRWLEKEGWNSFVDYENKVDAIIDRYHVIALCPYYLDMCSTAGIIDVVSNHQSALIKREGKWERIENSGRKRAEKALQVSEERYRSLYENSLDGILLTKPDGTVLCANPQACQMFGMTEDEIIRAGRDGLAVNDEKLADALEERRLTGRARAELIYRRKDGSTFVCDTTSKLFVGADGDINTCQIIRDISECKQSEDALQKSEAELARAQQISQIGSWTWDLITNEITWSEQSYRNYGLVPGEVKPSYDLFLSFIVPEDREMVDREIQKSIESGHKYIVTYNIIRRDGTPRILLSENEIVTDDSGKVVLMYGTNQDITERKRAEEALRLSNLYNRSLIEASLDPFMTIGSDGKITDVNNSTEIVTGYSRNELIGTDFSDYFTEPEKAREAYRHAFQERSVRDYPLEMQHKNGHVTPVLYNVSVYKDESGKVLGVFAAARDTTELLKAKRALQRAHDNLEKLVEERTIQLESAYLSLKENEKSLSEAQKMAHVGNWDWDLITGKVHWSDELCRIFGRGLSEADATYDELLNYVHPDDRDYVDSAVKRSFTGACRGIDYRIITGRGEERTVYGDIEVIFDQNNTPVRARGIIQDVTERKKAEEALANIEIVRKKEIHHRIKNNLQVISSLLDLQADKFNNREDIKDSEVLEAFRESQDRVISMALIHEELYKGGGLDTLNFSSYIEELAENLFQTYRLGNDNLRLNMDLEENIFFDMDVAVPLGIIVNELVSNSLKHAFTEDKEGEIRIQLCREEKSTETQESLFSLTISDNGKGISEKIDLENVESLGLKLVSILVAQLNGKIELKRTNGTEFRITFNVAE